MGEKRHATCRKAVDPRRRTADPAMGGPDPPRRPSSSPEEQGVGDGGRSGGAGRVDGRGSCSRLPFLAPPRAPPPLAGERRREGVRGGGVLAVGGGSPPESPREDDEGVTETYC